MLSREDVRLTEESHNRFSWHLTDLCFKSIGHTDHRPDTIEPVSFFVRDVWFKDQKL